MFGLDLVMAGWVTLASAQPLDCSQYGPAEISVIPQKSRIKYDYSKSKKDLNEFNIDTVSPYDASAKTHVGGLMSGKINTESSIIILR